MSAVTPFNPFPGLRPFETDEEYLFFGREGQSEEILRRLRLTRFLAVIGASGSGKSSLIRAGLLPYLFGGFMAGAGSHWRTAIFRPGGDPVGNLARALNDPGVLGTLADQGAEAARNAVLLEVTLRRSGLGLIEAVRLARLPEHENLLIVVDQFEELFRFADATRALRQEDDAAAFVKLLLEATRQNAMPIYVVLTMRSDFIGDCARFQDLPEAVTSGLYLIPRMTREQLRSAIEEPARVGNAEISRRLVTRLLNDVGENMDELPTLQHALMRSWDYWGAHRSDGRPIDLEDYTAIGGMSEALSRHAEEAYSELPTERSREIARRLFLALTEKGPDNRELRRPTAVADIATVAGADVSEVIPIIEAFRRPGRSFLMPPSNVPLDEGSVIDISHESLIRGWKRLKEWVDDESESARIYCRLAETAALHAQRKAGLWDDPDLQNALAWREKERPTAAWGRRYYAGFEQAMAFLDESRQARETKDAERKRHRERELRQRSQLAIAVAAVVFLAGVSTAIVYYANRAVQAEHRAKVAGLKAQAVENEARVAAREAAMRQAQALQQQAEQNAVQEHKLRGEAEQARRAAEQQRRIAEQQRRIAEQQRRIAEENARKAHDAEGRANANAAEASRQAGLATAGRLVSGAALQSASQPDLALLLAMASRRINDVPENRYSLFKVLNADLRFITPLRGHTANVLSVSFSRDGTLVASGSSRPEQTIRLWRVATGQQLRSLTGHTNTVWSVAFSPVDANLLASGAADKTIRLWDVATGRELRSLAGHTGEVLSVAFSPNGQLLASGGGDNTVRLWEVATGKQLRVLGPDDKSNPDRPGHTGEVVSVAFSPNGQLLASGSADRTIRIWDVATGMQQRSPLKGHTNTVWSVAFSPVDVNLLASGGGDNTVRLWEVAAGRELHSLPGQTGAVLSVAFSPNGTSLVTASQDNTVRLWDVRDVAKAGPQGLPLKAHSNAVETVAFSPDGKTLASGSVDKTVILWDITAPQRLGRLLKGHGGTVWDVTFSPNGQLLASGGSDSKIILWEVATGKQLHILGPGDKSDSDRPGHTGTVFSVAFSPDGKTLASGGADKTIRLWDVAAGRPVGVLGPGDPNDPRRPGHTSGVWSVAFSPNGHLLASGGSDSKVILWEVATGKQLHILGPGDKSAPDRPGHTGEVESVAFSPDGRLLASGDSDSKIILWEVATGKQLHIFGPGDKLNPGRPGHTGEVESVAFSPDGRLLASGGSDLKIILWEVATGQQLHAHPGQPSASVVFSPTDGKLLVSAGADGTIVLWDVQLIESSRSAKLSELGRFMNAHAGTVWSVAFRPDGKTLASGSKDKNIFLWDLSYESWEHRACRIAKRNLSQEEWRYWIDPTGSMFPYVQYEHICPP